MSKRRLAAILFSDIVGYTALMNRDEKLAFDFLRKNRKIHWRLIRKYRGRWLKEMGDGILASFSSSSDAIMCGLSIQSAAREMNIPLRIGIHQGDVIFEKNDVLGDGVNIASRIQGIADTNGIVISETVYNDIKNKEGIQSFFLGRKSLKGVETEVGVYRIYCKDNSLLDYTIDTGELYRHRRMSWATISLVILPVALLGYLGYYFLSENRDHLSEKSQSVLVLPFDNYTGTDTLDYFVAGMHDALIADFGKISTLRVISKTTSNAYKDTEKPLPDIAAELGVNVVIEASVLCLGDSACLQVKAVGVYPEEQQLWVQDFMEEKSQILNLYYAVTRQISDKINVYLTPQEESLLTDAKPVHPEAYDAYLKGLYIWEQLNPVTMMKAMDYFQIANEKDPEWAAPYARLALCWSTLKRFNFIPPDSADGLRDQYLDRALELDPNSANSHYFNAIFKTWTDWDWEQGEAEFKKTLELNPNDALCHIFYAHLLMILHRFDESLEQAEIALELDPLRPFILGLYAVVMNGAANNHESAIKYAQRAQSLDPENQFSFGPLANAYRKSGRYEQWFEIWKAYIARLDGEILSSVEKIFREEGFRPAVEAAINYNDKIHENGGRIIYREQGWWCLWVGNYEKGMDYWEKAYEARDGLLAYASLYALEFPALKKNSRYIALMKKMNLPVG
jgi:adenylate cyclase